MVTRRSAARSTTNHGGRRREPTPSTSCSRPAQGDDERLRRQEVILSILGPGDSSARWVLIDDEPRSASVVTIEPCELLAIAKRDFRSASSRTTRWRWR